MTQMMRALHLLIACSINPLRRHLSRTRVLTDGARRVPLRTAFVVRHDGSRYDSQQVVWGHENRPDGVLVVGAGATSDEWFCFLLRTDGQRQCNIGTQQSTPNRCL